MTTSTNKAYKRSCPAKAGHAVYADRQTVKKLTPWLPGPDKNP